MSQLKETNATLDFYTDFNKIRRNVQNIEISLNMLNFLLGKDDLYSAVKALWDRDPKVFNVLDILIATRREGKKKVHRCRWRDKIDKNIVFICRWNNEVFQ